jgi:broad specificity phosphatase PhoE
MPGGQGVRVLLVRHAQSQNNIVQAAVQAKIKAGMSPQQAQVKRAL